MGKYEIFILGDGGEKVLGEVEADFLPAEGTSIRYKEKKYFVREIVHHIKSSDEGNLESKVRVRIRKI